MLVTTEKTKFARMRFTSADIDPETTIKLTFKLKKDGSATDSNKLRYSFKIDVINCPRRNAALEIINIFMIIGNAHLQDIADKFRTKISKWADKISDIISPNGSPSISSKLDYQIDKLAFIRQKIENVYEILIKPNNNDEIKYLTYGGLPDGIRLFKYAD
jgi:hypothetical protein